MENQSRITDLEAENARLKIHLALIKSTIDAEQVWEQINGSPAKTLVGTEEKAARFDHIVETFQNIDADLYR